MVFEIGKYYEHSSGEQLYICGKVKSHLYGECLIAETGRNKNKWPIQRKYISMGKKVKPLYIDGIASGYFKPVGTTIDNTQNYKEITEAEFMLNNFDLDEDDKILYERELKLKNLLNER